MNLSMSRANTNTSQSSKNSFKELQLQIEEFRQKRDDLNKKTKEFINKLQEIDVEIEKKLVLAKDDYKKKRDYWNSKVKNLKDKKIEYKNILDKFVAEKKALIKESKKGKENKKYVSIKQIDKKIENLERRIEIENLDIPEENAMVDKIRELAHVKQEFLAEQQNSEFLKIERKIQIVKINLNKIYEQLNKWSNKSQDYHAKMHEIYQNVNELREKKKKLEEELIENKKAADNYHEKFLRVMSKIKKESKGKRPTYTPKKYKAPKRQRTIKNEELEKLKQDKLAIALEKQKSGKKLNLYEARLILESSKE
jgi:chromosome segregation protein